MILLIFIMCATTARPLPVRKARGGSSEQAVGLRMLLKWGTPVPVTGIGRPDHPDLEGLDPDLERPDYCVLDSFRDLASLRFDYSKGDIDGG